MDLIPVLQGVLPSIAAALLLVSLAGVSLLALAAAIGLFVAHGLLKDWPAWPHELWRSPDGRQWLVWAVVVAAGLTLLENSRIVRGRVAAAAAFACCAIGCWLVLEKMSSQWTSGEVLLYVGGGGLAAGSSALLLRRFFSRAKPGAMPAFAATALLAADAVLLAANGSALLGQLCGAVAAAVGAGLGTALWRRPFGLRQSDGTWIGCAHGLFLLAGVHLSYLPWSLAGIAAAAPIVLQLFCKQRAAD